MAKTWDTPGDRQVALDEPRGKNSEQEAAIEATDPDRLLDGEDPDTNQVSDAEHWIRVYTDLLAFKRRLLTRAQEMTPELGVAARTEVARTDLVVLDAEAKKFQRRLAWWKQRRDELSRR